MNVVFDSRALRYAFEDVTIARRQWGMEVAYKYIDRVTYLQQADWDSVILRRALRAHPLRGVRNGEWALSLHGRWRLIIIPNVEENEVTVLEVSNHYGD